jgi:arylsulfatase A-like enzyme
MNLKNKFSRRDLFKTAAVGMAGLAVQSVIPKSLLANPIGRNASTARPNILFLSVDQLSWNSIACNGCTTVNTPNIDKIFQNGLSFDQSYASCPICSPARTSWYTGREPIEHGVVDMSPNSKIVGNMFDIGQVFISGGYETAFFGKWAVTGRDPEHNSFTTCFEAEAPKIGEGEHRDDVVARLASGFLASRASSDPLSADPFLMMVNLVNPHDVVEWKTALDNEPADFPIPEITGTVDSLPLPPNFHKIPKIEPGLVQDKVRGQPESQWSDRWWKYYIWGYQRYIEMADDLVGQVMDTLARSPYADNTLVVFTSDHGEGQGCHKTTGKEFLYDEAARVPYVFTGNLGGQPIRKGKTNMLTAQVDLMPTLCEYASITTPDNMRGKSLKQVVDGNTDNVGRAYIRAECEVSGRMIRSDQYKYIKYEDDGVEQFFNMQLDPWEKNNLVTPSNPSPPDIQQYRDWLTEYDGNLIPA